MEQRLTMITLGVGDMDKMRSFYEEKFRWAAREDSNEQIVFFKLNGILLGLFGKQALAEDATVDAAGEGFRGFTLAHNLQSEAEVDKLFTEFKAQGVTVTKDPEKTSWGGYSGYIADPEGNLWEIAYNPFMEYDDSGNVR